MQTEIALGSSYRVSHPVILKKAGAEEKQAALEFLNKTCHDLVISQRLTPDKAEVPLKKGIFYISTYTSNVEPGYLVFLKNQVPVYVRTNLTKREREKGGGEPICYILRLRVSAEVSEGSVLIVSVDTNERLLMFEDVYVWRNKNIFQDQPFSLRRRTLQEFVSYHWTPDPRLLGGMVASIIQPQPLTTCKTLCENKDIYKINFLPESAGKRRFVFLLNSSIGSLTEGFYARKNQERTQGFNTPVKKAPTVNSIESTVSVAYAIRIPEIPDVYELVDFTTRASMGKACVQQLDLSIKLKKIPVDEIKVSVAYNDNFKRYEITGCQ